MINFLVTMFAVFGTRDIIRLVALLSEVRRVLQLGKIGSDDADQDWCMYPVAGNGESVFVSAIEIARHKTCLCSLGDPARHGTGWLPSKRHMTHGYF